MDQIARINCVLRSIYVQSLLLKEYVEWHANAITLNKVVAHKKQTRHTYDI